MGVAATKMRGGGEATQEVDMREVAIPHSFSRGGLVAPLPTGRCQEAAEEGHVDRRQPVPSVPLAHGGGGASIGAQAMAAGATVTVAPAPTVAPERSRLAQR